MSGWTDERVERLKSLWAEGLSASQSARVLGIEFGFLLTRNAVIGKTYRLKLRRIVKPYAGTATQRQLARQAKAEMKRMLEPPRIDPPPEPKSRRIPLLKIDDTGCRWPSWGLQDAQDFPCCGHPTQQGSVYCAFHTGASLGPGTHSERAARKALADFSVRVVGG